MSFKENSLSFPMALLSFLALSISSVRSAPTGTVALVPLDSCTASAKDVCFQGTQADVQKLIAQKAGACVRTAAPSSVLHASHQRGEAQGERGQSTADDSPLVSSTPLSSFPRPTTATETAIASDASCRHLPELHVLRFQRQRPDVHERPTLGESAERQPSLLRLLQSLRTPRYGLR